MAFRLFTCVLIVLCGGLTGYELRRRLSIRLRSIEMIRDYLRDVRAYISHTGMSLDDIAISLDNGAFSNQFTVKTREYSLYESFPSAFANALKVNRRLLCLTDNDIERIGSCIQRVGCYDLDGTLSCLDFADEKISSFISGARRKCETDGKLYITVGSTCGAIAALIIL